MRQIWGKFFGLISSCQIPHGLTDVGRPEFQSSVRGLLISEKSERGIFERLDLYALLYFGRIALHFAPLKTHSNR